MTDATEARMSCSLLQSLSLFQVFILSRRLCEQDDETKQTVAFKLYGYNGEDFIRFDIETEKWITSNPLAKTTKQEWDRKTASNGVWKNFLTTVCPDMMKMYFNDAKSFLDRKGRVKFEFTFY